MRWQQKEQTIYDKIQKRFAFFPKKVNNEWIWFESYYRLRCWNFLGCYEEEYRWLTREEAEYDIQEAINEHNT